MTYHTDTALFQASPTIPKDVSRSWARLDGVDVLRGLAIFFVLMNHVKMRLFLAKIPYTQGLSSRLVDSLVWNGQYGVQMFFAVSGFLITWTSAMTQGVRRWMGLLVVCATIPGCLLNSVHSITRAPWIKPDAAHAIVVVGMGLDVTWPYTAFQLTFPEYSAGRHIGVGGVNHGARRPHVHVHPLMIGVSLRATEKLAYYSP